VSAVRAAQSSWRPFVLAVFAGVVAFVFGTTLETYIIQAVHGNRARLEWISDVVVSIGVVALTYLWLHLRASRMRLLALEREQVALDEQLRLSAEIQRASLPEIPDATPGFRWAARMIPAGRIGGDFYDFYQLTADVALVILGDVSGKGIPAALLLSSVKTLFRTIVRETTDPGAVAGRLSTALFEEHAGMPYVTAIVARFESALPRVIYVNAGHPSAYLFREGETRALASGGPPLGLLGGVGYAAAEEELRSGDFGVMLTDGVTEALETGPTTVKQVVRRAWDEVREGRSLKVVCDDVLLAAAGGCGPAGVVGWQDDRTVFVFAVEGMADLSGTAPVIESRKRKRNPGASSRRLSDP
jgi:sigma-B regulation protein RsbU (phosphoserine phosphatase)